MSTIAAAITEKSKEPRNMSGNIHHQSQLAPQSLDAEYPLASLTNRTQTDFEIEFYERILNRVPNYVEVLICLGELFSDKKLYRRALKVDQRLALLRPRNATVHFNLACTLSRLKKKRRALAVLNKAVELGFSDITSLLDDPDLDALRNIPQFQAILFRVADRFPGPYIL
jgi:tetratricopeptide (TPR) repeat protein